jgi:hypothetical protein
LRRRKGEEKRSGVGCFRASELEGINGKSQKCQDPILVIRLMFPSRVQLPCILICNKRLIITRTFHLHGGSRFLKKLHDVSSTSSHK